MLILAALLALRLIFIDFRLLNNFGAVGVEPYAQTRTVSNSSANQFISSANQFISHFIKPISASAAASDSVSTDASMCSAPGTVLSTMQRILCVSRLHPELSLVDVLRSEIICNSSHATPCPEFHPNISKFAGLEDVHSQQKWAKLSQNEVQRQISLRMWHAKRMDIAAARVLGCAVVDGHEFTAPFENPKSMLHTNGMCYSHQQIHILLPLVVFSVRGQVINRTEYLQDPKNDEWYRSFGYNPLAINNSRLAYEAPAFTHDEWMQFCFMAVARPSMTSQPPQPQSRLWLACSSFAASILSKHYQYGMLKCFDVPASFMSATPDQLTANLPTYGTDYREYIEQCRSNNVTNDDAWSLRDLAGSVFRALRDRWDAVQSVYVQRLLQYNYVTFCPGTSWRSTRPTVTSSAPMSSTRRSNGTLATPTCMPFICSSRQTQLTSTS